MTCTTVDGLDFIATSNDVTIMRDMYLNRRTWSEYDMKLFHELARQFYQVDDSGGMFLDLGANIGTTGIYFTKKLAPNLKLLAFEPDPENFKMLRANLILNDIDRNSIAENFGLGAEENTQTMYRNPFNPGSNSMCWGKDEAGREVETVRIISLDKYFAEKNLSAADVKYIWIDTEGFEMQVLLGAKNILTENPAPIFMEFNPYVYEKSGMYETMMNFLAEFYASYVLSSEAAKGAATVYPVENLRKFQGAASILEQHNIFLIKKS